MITPLTVVLWKWGTKYTSEHVNVMFQNLKRYLKVQHHVLCITDDPTGLDNGVWIYPLPCELERMNSRRLWIFSDEAKRLGSRILQLDIDQVLTGDITALIDRPEPFVIWKSSSHGTKLGYALNPSVLLMNTGKYSLIWEKFVADPAACLMEAYRNGGVASDQAVITYMLSTSAPMTGYTGTDRDYTKSYIAKSESEGRAQRRPFVPMWDDRDGILSYRDHLQCNPYTHPEGAKIVSFFGDFDPINYKHLPWVESYWNYSPAQKEYA
ncbi:MAG: hypothetical protein ACREJN_21285 [Nitrospiraceae bacterium]